MKIDEKRKAIEVLLCASGSPVVSAVEVASYFDLNIHRIVDALTPTYRDTPRCNPGLRYADRQIEAAYRLIETSPTLRREWFLRGAP